MLLLLIIFAGCKNKKAQLTDEDTVAISDFIEFFPVVKLPYQLNDSILNKQQSDSSTIGYKIFTQFVPDSVLKKQFGSGAKPLLYPLGKVVIKKFETYLFMKAVSSGKKAGYLLALDKNNNFITAMPLVVTDKDASTFQSGEMDAKYAVTQMVKKKDNAGQVSEAKRVYILNAEAHAFSMIMSDEGAGDQPQDVINPIDTLPHHSKYAGDYIKDKRNYISVRDGSNASGLLFFIHFEKDNGDCKGELKGQATLHGQKTAVFKAIGNPCELEFTFSGNTVSMKETAACGSYRDIKCFFDGSFSRKKESTGKPGNKKKI